MRVCLITEKPSLGATILPYVAERHPDLEMDGFACVFVCPYTHLNSLFRYPRGLSMRDYPFTGEAAYAPFTFDSAALRETYRMPRFGFSLSGHPGSTPQPPARLAPASMHPGPAHAEAVRRLHEADVVYVALDPGDSSSLALERSLEAIGLDADRLAVLRLHALDSSTIRAQILHPASIAGSWYHDAVAAARLRRRFDYAYQVNALAVHGQAMRDCGSESDADVPSKYGLQLLYAMRPSAPLRDGEWIERMCRWEGTGRWRGMRVATGRSTALGGPASQVVILDTLARSGLTQRRKDGLAGISARGLSFLDRLHPGSLDSDLPFRLEAWKTDPEGRRKVDRYIRTFFGRQIRFATKRPPTSGRDAVA